MAILRDVLTLLRADHALMIFVALFMGLCVGSFLNVVIYRLPIMMSHWRRDMALRKNGFQPGHRPRFNLAYPASACPRCGHNITALENIPVLSWIFLKGQCSGCALPISARYPFVELLTGFFYIGVYLLLGVSMTLVMAWVAGTVLIAFGGILYDLAGTTQDRSFS